MRFCRRYFPKKTKQRRFRESKCDWNVRKEDNYDQTHKLLLSCAFSYAPTLHLNEKFDLLIVFSILIAEKYELVVTEKGQILFVETGWLSYVNVDEQHHKPFRSNSNVAFTQKKKEKAKKKKLQSQKVIWFKTHQHE